MGRHVGHSFIYLQDALQDSRTLTIQLLADAQQGRQAIQVRYSQLEYFISPSFFPPQLVTGQSVKAKNSASAVSLLSPSVLSDL